MALVSLTDYLGHFASAQRTAPNSPQTVHGGRMATTKSRNTPAQVSGDTRLAKNMAGFDKLMSLVPGAHEIAGLKLALTTLGDLIVGRLEQIREGTDKKSGEVYRIYDFSFPGGNSGFLLGSGNLNQKLSGALAGHVLGILYEDDMDLGQPSLMKVFRVVDFGENFPPAITAGNCVSIADAGADGMPF